MEPMKPSFDALVAYLSRAIEESQDPRKASNATKYSLSDVVLGAFSVFFMQCESFLEHQRQMHSQKGKSNAQTLFRVNEMAAYLLTLNVLAFLFHTVLHLVDQKYQESRGQRVTRKGFFQDILSPTKYLLFDSWQSLIDFMLYGSDSCEIANSS